MKKIILLLLAVTVFISSASLAEGLPAPSEPRPFGTADFRSAVDGAEGPVVLGSGMEYLSAVMEKGGSFFRVITLLDDRARELLIAAEKNAEEYGAFKEYAWSLPVGYIEEITAKPKTQAELDALAGKTVGEILKEGYSLYGHGGREDSPVEVSLSYGMFTYEFEADTTFGEYLERAAAEDLESLKVKGGKLYGCSTLAADPDYLPNGTYDPMVVPNYTREELAALRTVPPAEEYTAKAWPVTAETYADLLNHHEEQFGQVYMIKGAVRQILSADPLTAVVCTGEDGQTMPVVVECPGISGFSPEAGDSCRIYADVSSSLYILPVLTARYVYTEQP